MLFTSFGAGRILPGISEKSASPEDLPAGSERRDFMLVYAEENNFEELVMKAQKPVLVDFFASWCGPCRMLAKELDDMASDDGYTVVKVDIDRNPRLAEQWNNVVSSLRCLSLKRAELSKSCPDFVRKSFSFGS